MMKALVALLVCNDMTTYFVAAKQLLALHLLFLAIAGCCLAGCKPPSYTKVPIFLSKQPDLNGMTLEGTNAKGEHCEVAFCSGHKGSSQSFTFSAPLQATKGDMWWYYESLLILNFRNFGFRGQLFPEKIVFEDVTPLVASVDLKTIFGGAYRDPREGIDLNGSIDCGGQSITAGISILDSAWMARAQIESWRKWEQQTTHRELKPLPVGLGDTGYLEMADLPNCLSCFVFARNNVLISMPESNRIRTEANCEDAILKAVRLLDGAVVHEQNGVTMIRMPKVLVRKK